MGISCTFFEIWPWDGQRTEDGWRTKVGNYGISGRWRASDKICCSSLRYGRRNQESLWRWADSSRVNQ